mmetsp:Transcript_82829/g.146367  ORF Transcript_82829/g.146367 Transcript_82829/m.146367 type:complete len:216 (-) Transcript_82829:2234-2881(-)
MSADLASLANTYPAGNQAACLVHVIPRILFTRTSTRESTVMPALYLRTVTIPVCSRRRSQEFIVCRTKLIRIGPLLAVKKLALLKLVVVLRFSVTCSRALGTIAKKATSGCLRNVGHLTPAWATTYVLPNIPEPCVLYVPRAIPSSTQSSTQAIASHAQTNSRLSCDFSLSWHTTYSSCFSWREQRHLAPVIQKALPPLPPLPGYTHSRCLPSRL